MRAGLEIHAGDVIKPVFYMGAGTNAHFPATRRRHRRGRVLIKIRSAVFLRGSGA